MTKLNYTNSINELQAKLGNVIRAGLETNDIEILRGISDELARVIADKQKVDESLRTLLLEETQDMMPGEKIKFGLYEYEKVQKKSISKLDESKLADLIQDQDILDSCYEVVRKPLTQIKLNKLFAENKINVDIKQLYTQELKDAFELKAKN